MGNFISMVQKELLYQLFASNWTIRKISKSMKLHRNTVRRYYKLWKMDHEKRRLKIHGQTTFSKSFRYIQSVPPQVPPVQVVHFEVPPVPENNSKSKSKASQYDSIIRQKLELGQSAKSIYQDLVTEHSFTGSYDSIKRYVRK